VARAPGGVVDVKVKVAVAPWVEVERVEIRLARGTAPAPAILSMKKVASGALEGDAPFTLRLKEDDAFVVMVSGTKPMRPLLSGEDADIAPWAMTAPIWIDVDGDGKALGRKR